jgi:integrase
MSILTLTHSLIANDLQCPAGKRRVEICDADLPGLYVEVRACSPGQGTFYLRYKDASGKTCHQKIGRTAEIGLTEARKQTRALKADIALGADPRGEARQAALTFAVCFEDRYLPYVKLRKRSWEKDEALFRLRLKAEFGHLPLDGITRHQVQAFHSSMKANGLAGATCDHHVKLLRHALNLAVEWGMLEKNPIARVHLFNDDNKVERYLDDAELARLLTVLRSDSRRAVCSVALFLRSTGARLNEALHAQWSQIDRANRVWRIPASNSKSKRVRAVPLNDSALDVLNQLGTEGEFDYLFTNRQTGKPYVGVHKVWERLRLKAGLPTLRIHDLRHQYASFLVNSGRTLYEVQQILGHADSQVTQRYAHLSTKSLQDAANSASLIIQGVRGSA